MGNINSAWNIWPFVVRIVVPSALQTMLFPYNIAAFTVIYMDCTAVLGELVWGVIAEEFAGDYVSLPFDDGKIPHFVSVPILDKNAGFGGLQTEVDVQTESLDVLLSFANS